jgi:hypothetical protein
MLLTIGVRLVPCVVVEEINGYTQVVRRVQSGEIHIAFSNGRMARFACLNLWKSQQFTVCSNAISIGTFWASSPAVGSPSCNAAASRPNRAPVNKE